MCVCDTIEDKPFSCIHQPLLLCPPDESLPGPCPGQWLAGTCSLCWTAAATAREYSQMVDTIKLVSINL